MAQIIVRNLSDETKEKLRVQAAEQGVSLEAYIRDVLKNAAANVTQGTDITKTFQRYFGKRHGVNLTLSARKSNRPVPNFEQ